MTEHRRELTEEQVKKAEEQGVYSLFSDSEKIGYGVYCAKIYEEDGKKMLYYEMGSSCD